MDHIRSIVIAVDETSVAGAVNRVISDAVKAGRMSFTEAAVVYDFVCHSEMPERFRLSRKNGGAQREERF